MQVPLLNHNDDNPDGVASSAAPASHPLPRSIPCLQHADHVQFSQHAGYNDEGGAGG